jgi:methionyl-tRNA formyltransferase
VPIRETDTAASLHDTLAAAGARAIVAALANYPALVPVAQDDREATYAAKLSKEEAKAGLAPARRGPGARGARLQSGARRMDPAGRRAAENLVGQVVAGSGAPGEVLHAEAASLVVACGSGALALEEIQPAGSKRMSAAAYLAGRPLPPGSFFGH